MPCANASRKTADREARNPNTFTASSAARRGTSLSARARNSFGSRSVTSSSLATGGFSLGLATLQDAVHGLGIPAGPTRPGACGVEPPGNAPNGQPGAAHLPDRLKNALLSVQGLDMNAVGGNLIPEGHFAHALAAGLLYGHCGASTSADQRPLVLRETIHNAPHQLRFRSVAIARPIGGQHPRP